MADKFLKKAFPSFLRRLRQSAALSQEELATSCQLDRTYISLLERGQRLPSLDALLKISESLGKAPDQFVSELMDEINAYKAEQK